ncbi:hypothetical protein [Nocardiopsis synnemataformans]|uniref:hypothetical protein n=1 Tax=Nocardiopsis synnemataformans TaxID=61305 RepID=UPI003EBE7187
MRGVYLDVLVEGKEGAYAGRAKVALARSVFQVDLALFPLRAALVTLLLYGLGLFFSYSFSGQIGAMIGGATSVGVMLCFSYFGSVGLISFIDFLRSLRIEKKFGGEALFASLSLGVQFLIFTMAFPVSFALQLFLSGS